MRANEGSYDVDNLYPIAPGYVPSQKIAVISQERVTCQCRTRICLKLTMSDPNSNKPNASERRRRQELNRRELLVLIYAHLMEEGFIEAAESLRQVKQR